MSDTAYIEPVEAREVRIAFVLQNDVLYCNRLHTLERLQAIAAHIVSIEAFVTARGVRDGNTVVDGLTLADVLHSISQLEQTIAIMRASYE